MKNVLKTAVALAAIASAIPAGAQLPGLPPAAEPESSVRPTEKNDHTIVVQPTGPIRGSLYKQAARAPIAIGPDGQQIGTSPVDFTETAPAKPKKYQKNDIVTIIVAENSSTATSSASKNEKKQDFDFALQQFLQLAHSASGLPSVGVVGQPSKLPEVKFKYDNSRDASADQNRTDTFTVRISATVVDVKPNGTMVIEAVRKITVDKEVQEYKMSGICRVEDVTAENTVISTQLANLNLSKKTSGEVHNGVKSGWLNNVIDKFNPF